MAYQSIFRQRVHSFLRANAVGVSDSAGKTAIRGFIDDACLDGENGAVRLLAARPVRFRFWFGLCDEYRVCGCFSFGFVV